jgi:hypothetical protein
MDVFINNCRYIYISMGVKCFFLFSVSFLFGGKLFANDTLTRAQVYNFNVGDTFDYMISARWQMSTPTIHSSLDFERYIIMEVYSSADLDTLFIVRKREYPQANYNDTVIIDSSLRFEILYARNQYLHNYGGMTEGAITELNSPYNGRMGDSISMMTLGNESRIKFVQGLGRTFYYSSGGDGSGTDWGTSITSLIYYSRGSEKYGTPYYLLDGETLIHFTPLPEECATWIRTIQKPQVFGGELLAQEKIVTGRRIASGGHTLVEMIYSFIDFSSGASTSDSLIGYFRNDTAAQKVYLYQTLDSLPFYTYDFTRLVGNDINGIYQLEVGGVSRTIWYGNNIFPYAEGIGGLCGLFPVKRYFLNLAGILPQEIGGYLSCFSVCGNILYPDSTPIGCEFLNSVSDIVNVSCHLNFYPTLVSNKAFLLVEGNLHGIVSIYDLQGRMLLRTAISTNRLELDASAYPDGIYFWTYRQLDQITQSGKFIVQH